MTVNNVINLDTYAARVDRYCGICHVFCTGSAADVADHKSRCIAMHLRNIFRATEEANRRRQQQQQQEQQNQRNRRD